MRNHLRHLALAVMAIGGSVLAQRSGQEWSVRHYSGADGLSQSSVISIVQDTVGFLWLGTEDGINRFDGREFKVYREAWMDSVRVLSSVQARLQYTAHHGLVAVTDRYGLLVFDPIKDRFDAFPVHPLYSADPRSNTVRAVAEIGPDTLLLATLGGLYIMNTKSRAIVNLSDLLPQVPRSMMAWGIERYGNALLVVMQDRSYRASLVLEISGDLRSVRPMDLTSAGIRTSADLTSCAIHSHGTELWLSANDRVFVQRTPDGPFAQFSSGPLRRIKGMKRFGNEIWFVTSLGLYHCDTSGRGLVKVPILSVGSQDGARNILDIFQDPGGGIWVGTFDGLYQLDQLSTKFHHLGGSADPLVQLCDTKVRGLLKDKLGHVWVGSETGTDLLAPDRRSVAHRISRSVHDRLISYSALEVPDGSVWLRSHSHGLFEMARDGKVLAHLDRSNSVLSADNGYAMAYDRRGYLITGSCLDLLDLRTRQIIPSSEIFPAELGSFNPFCLFSDSKNKLWMGSIDFGLYSFEFDPVARRTSSIKHYSNSLSDNGSISNDFITCIREDRDGMIWCGTYGGGLERLDPSTSTFTHHTMADGLPNDVVYALEVDARNRIWFTTNKGIACLDQRDGSVRAYDTRDGAQANEFNARASFQASDGEIFFGGINGFNSFYPDSIKLNPHVPKVAFTGLIVGHTPMEIGALGSPLHRSIVYQDSLELTHDQNDLTIKFAALSFISPEKNCFAYMLHGYDDEWVQLGTQNHVSFTNLDPGRYELRVKAANNDGIWNEEYRTLHLNITPPWYRTSTATALFIVCGASFLFGLGWIVLSRIRLRYQVDLEHEEAERAKAEDQRRARFFINLAHDLRTPLTLIKQRVEQLASHPNERMDEPTTQVMRRSVDKLTGRITALLETARLERDHIALDAEPTNINELLHVILADFRPMAADRAIELGFHPAPGDPIGDLDRTKVMMAVENLLSNAFKFTPDGGAITATITPLLVNGNDAIRITVRDTGPGIAQADHERIFDLYERSNGPQATGQVGAGVGLFHVRRIMEMHGGQWSIESAVGQGTAIHLDFPLKADRNKVPAPVVSGVASSPSQEQLSALAEETTNDPSSKPIALVIEDDRDLNAAIVDLLRSEFKTYSAFNGDAGIDKAFEVVPDLVITDVMMPGKDGFEVCRTLKTDVRTSHIPVIVLTAITDMEERIRGLHEGADDFLPKPYEPRELLARALNAIQRTQKVREHNRASFGLEPFKPLDPVRDMDRLFLEKVEQVIIEKLDDPALDVERLGSLVAMSRSNLSRKLSALIDRAPGELIREKRMTHARSLLEQGEFNVSEVMLKVGYENPPSFSNAFKDFWGHPPSHFLRRS